jgi:hypothetical protein
MYILENNNNPLQRYRKYYLKGAQPMIRILRGIFSLMLAFTLVFAMLVPAYATSPNEAETKATALKQLGLLKAYQIQTLP